MTGKRNGVGEALHYAVEKARVAEIVKANEPALYGQRHFDR
jgi:hypothetical protein